MDHKTYSALSSAVFAVVAAFHLARILSGWQATLGGWTVPMEYSWVGVVVAGYLAYTGYKLSKKR